MAKFFKKKNEIVAQPEWIKIQMRDGEINELRPNRLQYTFREACYMLCIKDPDTLKKYLDKAQIPYHKFGDDDRNFVLHDDLVKLLEQMINDEPVSKMVEATYDKTKQKK